MDSKVKYFVFSLSVLFLAFRSLSAQDTLSVSGNLEVHFIDVGQADAIFIRCPTQEHTMLIDAGDTRYPGSSANFKGSLENLTGGLNSKIDVVVASHPHADHIGSMRWVLENFDVTKYVDNGDLYESATYDKLMETVYEQDDSGLIEYEILEDADENFIDFCPADNVDAVLVRPEDNLDDCKNANNCSVVIRLDYNKSSFLFVGDTEHELEEKLLADKKTKKQLNVDVFKAGHHGSSTSSTHDFVKAVSPRYVVVSVGEKNRGTNKGYKHPQLSSVKNFNLMLRSKTYRSDRIEVYDKEHEKWRKKKVKARVYFTTIDGDVFVLTDGKRIWIQD